VAPMARHAGPARYGGMIARVSGGLPSSAAKAAFVGAAYATTEVVPSRRGS
jgi:hypothetical protein